MEYQLVANEMMVKRQTKFNGKTYEPINLFDVYYGKNGTEHDHKIASLYVQVGEKSFFNPSIGTLRLEDIPEILSKYNNDEFLMRVTDEYERNKILDILN